MTQETPVAEDIELAKWLEERDALMKRVDQLERAIFQRTSFLNRGVKS